MAQYNCKAIKGFDMQGGRRMKQISGGLFHGRVKCEFCGAEFSMDIIHSPFTASSYCPKCGRRSLR